MFISLPLRQRPRFPWMDQRLCLWTLPGPSLGQGVRIESGRWTRCQKNVVSSLREMPANAVWPANIFLAIACDSGDAGVGCPPRPHETGRGRPVFGRELAARQLLTGLPLTRPAYSPRPIRPARRGTARLKSCRWRWVRRCRSSARRSGRWRGRRAGCR